MSTKLKLHISNVVIQIIFAVLIIVSFELGRIPVLGVILWSLAMGGYTAVIDHVCDNAEKYKKVLEEN